MKSLQKPVVAKTREGFQMSKQTYRLVFVASILLVCVFVLYALHGHNGFCTYTSTSGRYGEFECLKVGDSLIIGRRQVEIDEGRVVCGTNRVPLVANSPYVYICGNNDIKVLRYSKQY